MTTTTRVAKKSSIFHFDRGLPVKLRDTFAKNPTGIARNIIEISLEMRIPNTVKSIEGLNQHMRRAFLNHETVLTRYLALKRTTWIGLHSTFCVEPAKLTPVTPVNVTFMMRVTKTITTPAITDPRILAPYRSLGYDQVRARDLATRKHIRSRLDELWEDPYSHIELINIDEDGPTFEVLRYV